MDKYFYTPKFKAILKTYEELRQGYTSKFLDAEELTDVGEYYYYKGMNKEMIDALDFAINLFPEAASPIALKAKVELFYNHNLKAAIALAEDIKDTNDIEYIYLIAEILLYQEKIEEANTFISEHYNYLSDQEERDEYALDIVNFFLDYSKVDFARIWLGKVTKQDTTFFQEAKARLLKENGQYEESLKAYNQLLDNNPYASEYWNELAKIQILHKDYNEAINSCEYAIAINPEDEDAILYKATALLTLDNYEDALKQYLRYKELVTSGDTSAVDVTIGCIYLIMNKEEEAKNYFEHAYIVSEDKPTTMIHIAISSFENGYVIYAYDVLSSIIGDCDEKWDSGYAHLARCCYELRKEEEFKKYLSVAAERNPEECTDVLADLFPEGTDPRDYPSTPVIEFN